MITNIINGTIITGDGKTIIERANLVIEDDHIAEISVGLPSSADKTIDASGCYVLPGLINTHTHGCSTSPLFTSASPALSTDRAWRNATRHMMQGVTSLINVCGMGTLEEHESVNKNHPMKIYFTTAQVPSTFDAASIVDGKGLRPEHYKITAREMIPLGAAAIGEIGSGATLGGGVSEYKLIPEAIEAETKMLLSYEQVHRLKVSIYDDNFSPRNLPEETSLLMTECKLDGLISLEKLLEIFHTYTIKPLDSALQSFDEGLLLAEEFDLPIIIHHAGISAPKILELAQKRKNKNTVIIAAHSNHPSYAVDACVHWVKQLKAEGVIIDVATLNCFLNNGTEGLRNLLALLEEDLVDIITTDFYGGAWEGISAGIQYLRSRSQIDLLKAINMATGRPASLFPKSLGNTGTIEPGKAADLLIADKRDLTKIEAVIIDGKVIVDGGIFQP